MFFDLIISHSHFMTYQYELFPLLHDNLFNDMQLELKNRIIYLMEKYIDDNSIQYICTDFLDNIPDEILEMIQKNKINLVAELYRTEDDYSNTLFKKDLKLSI